MAEGTIRWLLRPAVPSIEPGSDLTQDDYWRLVVQSSSGVQPPGGAGASGAPWDGGRSGGMAEGAGGVQHAQLWKG